MFYALTSNGSVSTEFQIKRTTLSRRQSNKMKITENELCLAFAIHLWK